MHGDNSKSRCMICGVPILLAVAMSKVGQPSRSEMSGMSELSELVLHASLSNRSDPQYWFGRLSFILAPASPSDYFLTFILPHSDHFLTLSDHPLYVRKWSDNHVRGAPYASPDGVQYISPRALLYFLILIADYLPSLLLFDFDGNAGHLKRNDSPTSGLYVTYPTISTQQSKTRPRIRFQVIV